MADTTKCPKVIDEALSGDYNDCSERGEQVAPADIMAAITSEQCTNLQNNVGLEDDGHTNCEDLQGMLCDIRQDLEAVLVNQAITIFANDFSKCSDDDENPTLASMWSRIYRFSQAVTCILCTYDSFMFAILKSGKYPQVLMGSPSSDASESSSESCSITGYPVWVTPDTYPTESSRRPVTSGGVYQAVDDAIHSVWHIWDDYPSFSYFANTATGGDYPLDEITGMVADDTCLVKVNSSSEYNVIYTYDGTDWQKTTVIGLGEIENFAVTHIEKGYWEDKGLYYFENDGVPSWNVMDANLTDLENRIDDLEALYDDAVLSGDSNEYLITTRTSVSAASAVSATTGKTTLVFVTS